MLFSVVCLSLLTSAASAVAEDADVKTLIGKLSSADKQELLAAIDDLSAFGADAQAAVPALIEVVGGEDSELAWHACRTLGAIGENAQAAVASLAKALGHDEAKVRAYAAFALGRIGTADLDVVDRLIETAFDKEELVRRASLRALQRIDPPMEKTLPLVLEVLEKGDLSIIMPALHTLAEEGKSEVPRLRKALENERARYWVCLVLAELGPDAAEAVSDLTAILDDEDPEVRLQAVLALGEIGKADKAALDAIVKLSQEDAYPPVRYAAVYALGKIGAGGAATAVLEKAMASDDEFLRTMGAWALARSHPDDKQLVNRAVRLIVDAFKSDNVDVRRAAARAVVEFDVDPELVAPALVEALKDKDETVVANAVSALAAFGPRALRHVDAALANKELRRYAVLLIARVGAEAEAAVPALIREIEKTPQTPEDVEFIREAQFALSAIGPGASAAIPALIKSLSADDDEIRASAAFALGKMGASGRAAVPALRQALRSESFIVKLASVRALLEIQPGQRQLGIIAAPLLLRGLDHDNELVRAEAARALGELGELGRRAIPRLKELSEDDSELVRQAAAEALKQLGQ